MGKALDIEFSGLGLGFKSAMGVEGAEFEGVAVTDESDSDLHFYAGGVFASAPTEDFQVEGSSEESAAFAEMLAESAFWLNGLPDVRAAIGLSKKAIDCDGFRFSIHT